MLYQNLKKKHRPQHATAFYDTYWYYYMLARLLLVEVYPLVITKADKDDLQFACSSVPVCAGCCQCVWWCKGKICLFQFYFLPTLMKLM
jgi:hypothetical protein